MHNHPRVHSIVLLGVALLWFPTSSTICQQHLEPESGVFSRKRDLQYYDRLCDALLSNDGPFVIARTVCIPFGQREWSVSLVLNVKSQNPLRFDEPFDTTFTVIGVKPLKPLGSSAAMPLNQKLRLLKETKILTYRRRIAREDATAIQEIFFSMVSETRYAEKDRAGLDGAGYHFSSFKFLFGSRSGQTWSPDAGTPPSRLVALSETLFDYAKADSSSENLTLDRLRSLIRNFSK